MTNDGSNTLVYDAENHAVSATNGGSSGTYAYDGNGLRVKKVSGGTTTVYIFSGSKVIAEYDNGAAPTAPSREYIYSGAALLAKIDSSGTKYYHQDLLSNRLVTDSSGNTVAQTGHYPFGESWYNASTDKLLFTSYERDAESGNDYAMARSYVNRLARFSSPDPLSGSIGNPQSLNKYAYAVNDAVNLTDPSGAFSCGSIWVSCDPPPPPDPHYDPDFDLFGGPFAGGAVVQPPPPLIYIGGRKGGGGHKFVNQKVLAGCIQDLFGVTPTQFVESSQGTNGSFLGRGPDSLSNGGNDANITVTNDVNSYSGQGLKALYDSRGTPPLPQGVNALAGL